MIERASPSWALKMASSPASGPLTGVELRPFQKPLNRKSIASMI